MYVFSRDFKKTSTLYTGVLIGTQQHQVSGQFYIIDSKTVFIENFNYDGGGPGEKGLCHKK